MPKNAPENAPQREPDPRDRSHPRALVPAFLGAVLRPPRASRGRFILAMCIALAADFLFFWLGEALPVGSDFVVALALALSLGGFSVELLGAFIAEATPGIGLFPAWSLAVPILWARANAARGRPPTPGAG
jgi:hypothetical protein